MRWFLFSALLTAMLFGCSGSGEQFCPRCNGEGQIVDTGPFKLYEGSKSPCPVCQGKGKVPKL